MAGFDPLYSLEAPHDASRTLFIGDLSYFCTEEDLCRVFAPYGPILTVRVRRGVTGDSLMHGFVALNSSDAALRAIRDLDRIEFMGRNMRVQLSADGQKPTHEIKDTYVQVHVSFISKQTSFLVTEKVLREIFSPFGVVADVAIKKHSIIQKQHRQSGYGFVYFYQSDSAYRAMQALKHNTVREITLDCSISHKSEEKIRTIPLEKANTQSSPIFSANFPPRPIGIHPLHHTQIQSMASFSESDNQHRSRFESRQQPSDRFSGNHNSSLFCGADSQFLGGHYGDLQSNLSYHQFNSPIWSHDGIGSSSSSIKSEPDSTLSAQSLSQGSQLSQFANFRSRPISFPDSFQTNFSVSSRGMDWLGDSLVAPPPANPNAFPATTFSAYDF